VPYLSWLAIIILSVIALVLYFIPLREVITEVYSITPLLYILLYI
jgi:hypothetical protein